MDREVSRSRREQEAGADRADRHRQSLQSLKADEGKARGAGRRRSRAAADHCEPGKARRTDAAPRSLK